MTDTKPYKKNSAIIISSRIRLARNLAGHRFTNSATDIQLEEVFNKSSTALSKVKRLKNGGIVDMQTITSFGRGMLLEEHVITKELTKHQQHRGVYISEDASVSVLINEEDHLRLQMLSKGQTLNSIWRTLNALDNAVEKNLEYAFSDNIGFLTSCPTNVGTGMRASIMLHLPALVISEDIDKVARGLAQLGIVLRGANGEGSDSYGGFFQLSNQQTLGFTEETIIKKIIKFATKVAEFEKNARLKLWQENPMVLIDKFSRIMSILASAKLMNTDEAMSLLSVLRLATDMGFVDNAHQTIKLIDEALLDVKPSHLQEKLNIREPDRMQRDAVRATYLNAFASNLPKINIL